MSFNSFTELIYREMLWNLIQFGITSYAIRNESASVLSTWIWTENLFFLQEQNKKSNLTPGVKTRTFAK